MKLSNPARMMVHAAVSNHVEAAIPEPEPDPEPNPDADPTPPLEDPVAP
ncbi:MAG: hypothetical protein NTW28_06485 [Candidatus Solibacter sp.]|nr:hypothetical protein [Candidatus Solibacter sp.]